MQTLGSSIIAAMRGGSSHGRRGAGYVSWVAWIGFMAVLIAPVPARADVVKLDNGDILHGLVIGGDGKTLKMKHATGGDLSIEYEKITSIETDQPVRVKLLDGTELNGKLIARGPGGLTVGTESAGPVSADFVKVAAVNEPKEDVVWTGRISIGATIVDGNSKSKQAFGSVDGERLSKKDRIEVHGYYAYGTSKNPLTHEDDLSTKKGFARMQYSLYVLRPFYLYAGAAFEYDRFQNLKLRSRGGGGVGVAVKEDKDLLLRFEAGVEYINEDYGSGIADKQFIALRGAGTLEWQATEWLRLGESVEIFPSLERFRDFFSRSVSSVNFSIFKGFGFSMIAIWEHDQIPSSPDRNRNDTTYLLTFTYVF
jgi:putative salt-induced outer membrane protein YdiY